MRWTMKIAAGLVAGLLATAASANVVYNWQPSTSGKYLKTTGGKMVITDTAYRAGSLHEDYGHGTPETGVAPGPIQSMKLNYKATPNSPNVGSTGVYFNSIDTEGGIDAITADLTIKDSMLDGDMFVYDVSDEAKAYGSGSGWNVYDVGSDFYNIPPCGPPQCDAGHGYWKLDPSTVPGATSNAVPAPPVWGLFALSALGLFSLIGLRRKA